MSSSRDVIVCKQAAFGVAMGNAGEEVKRQTNTVNGPWDDDAFAENGWTLMTDSRTP
jgi:hydroxymethylpyrimidine pyrophosphatase-like HAD family hydrolase